MKKAELEELMERVRDTQNELCDLKLYMRAKRNNFVARIRSHIIGKPPFTEVKKELEWLDDDLFCIQSFDVSEYGLNDVFTEIYKNDKDEMFIKTLHWNDYSYYKVNLNEQKLERVYFEGKKSTLGKKVWG